MKSKIGFNYECKCGYKTKRMSKSRGINCPKCGGIAKLKPHK